MTLIEARSHRAHSSAPPWFPLALCRGRSDLFFPRRGERPERRSSREAEARALCTACPVREPCRAWARRHREYGFWGGESEDERIAAGYRPAISGGDGDSSSPALESEAV